MDLTLSSTTFSEGATLPESTRFDGFGVGGDNRSPHLFWSGVPAGTQSFALIAHDPDAPTGVGFFHWIVFDIPANVRELSENAGARGGKNLPAGAKQGHTDFGLTHYGGAAPPPGHGPHRYEFRLYALDVPHLEANETTTGALLRFLMRGHTLAEATLIGIYER